MSGVPITSTFAVYRRLLAYTRPYGGRLAIGILAGVLGGGSLFGMLQVSPRLIEPFEGTLAPAAAPAAPAAQKPQAAGGLGSVDKIANRLGIRAVQEDGRMTWKFVAVSLLALPLLVLVKALTNYANRYYLRWVGSRVVRDLRDDLFRNLQNQSLAFFGRNDVGRLISSCTNDAGAVEQVIATTVADLTRAPVDILASLGFVVWFSYQQHLLGFVTAAFLVIPLCVVPVVVLGRYVKRHTYRALERISDLVSRMHETFTGVRVVKAFHTERRELDRFCQMNTGYFRSVIKAMRAELLMTPLMEAVALLLSCGFLLFCYARGVKLSQLAPMGLAAVVAYRPLKQVAQINAMLQRGAAAMQRIIAILDTHTELPEAEHPVVLDGFRNRIAFDRVSFAYEPGGAPVLSEIEFEIPKGSVVAVVGETGSGKTTLANLLARFYDPTSGSVLIDGTDLRQAQIASVRRLVGVVTQETILFNDTVRANVAYGAADATQAQVEAAAREANAHEFIAADPAGYDRVVGEKGFVLSGGERQRIAIARAILRNPPILILDEATSALDTVTERLVQQAIARVMKDRTVFAIAHRLSTVKHANLILLLDHGRIVERGSHEQLYAAGGRYRKLCDMQVLDA